MLVDGGTFDWESSGKFPTLTEPYAGYHGLDFAEEFGPQAFGMPVRRACGISGRVCRLPMPSTFTGHRDAAGWTAMWRTHEGCRVPEGSDAVEWVSYPGLESHPDHALANKLLPKGAGSMLAFGIKGGREAGRVFIERLQVWSHLANVGDAKSLVIHPASTTHQQMDAETMKAAGLGEDLVRLSVGLEDADDLIADLRQALRSATVRKAG